MHTGLRWIEDNTAGLVALAQAIWEYAELGLKEERSAAAQAEYLRKEDFDVQVGVAGMPTALVASWGQGKPAIGYLGEYAALNAPSYASSLAMNSVRFAFHGRAAHAAGAPHLGISALDGVELMNVGVNSLREHVILDARIHYVITHGGASPTWCQNTPRCGTMCAPHAGRTWKRSTSASSRSPRGPA